MDKKKRDEKSKAIKEKTEALKQKTKPNPEKDMKDEAAKTLQKVARGFSSRQEARARKDVKTMTKEYLIPLQSRARGYLARQKLDKMKKERKAEMSASQPAVNEKESEILSKHTAAKKKELNLVEANKVKAKMASISSKNADLIDVVPYRNYWLFKNEDIGRALAEEIIGREIKHPVPVMTYDFIQPHVDAEPTPRTKQDFVERTFYIQVGDGDKAKKVEYISPTKTDKSAFMEVAQRGASFREEYMVPRGGMKSGGAGPA